ncbi:MAG: type II toxin-antitoxin system VapC family toxin [Pyrinomonadaceae bacterium]|nr:type II toxin-antitoxin system VapC family toxin [Pyrinomonadaceae bacterium]
MAETFIDTFFVIAVVNRRDQYHKEAVKLAELYDGQPLVTTEAVLLEVGNSLAKNYKIEAVAAIKNFLDSDEVSLVRSDAGLFERGFDLYRRYRDKTWGLTDCVSFIVMRERGVTDALSANEDFRQAGFNTLLARP